VINQLLPLRYKAVIKMFYFGDHLMHDLTVNKKPR